ncbi:Glutathione S-transferase 1 (GST class-sigma) [Durusdinium trenchii]|uniref:Glutathione S-transferase 1 (GST class-sigma) n=1 Tax=Durusdinium trenchii TaxID=1381693 RepID=A0ABP0KFV2_9DINO
MPALKLTYFDIEGAAEKVRLAYPLGGVEFTDERVSFPEWGELKKTSKFGQLPLLEVEGKGTLAQSEAQLRYVAAQATGLYPEDAFEAAKVDEALGLVGDLARAWSPCYMIASRPEMMGYAADFKGSEENKAKVKEMREAFLANKLPEMMGYFAKLIEESGGFLASKEAPTIADCAALPQLRTFVRGFIDHVPTTSLDAFPVIKSYIDRMLSIPAVKAHYEAVEARKAAQKA